MDPKHVEGRGRVCFEVEKVIGISRGDGMPTYHVQWAPAWVSGFHLIGCEHLIQEFLQQLPHQLPEKNNNTTSNSNSTSNTDSSGGGEKKSRDQNSFYDDSSPGSTNIKNNSNNSNCNSSDNKNVDSNNGSSNDINSGDKDNIDNSKKIPQHSKISQDKSDKCSTLIQKESGNMNNSFVMVWDSNNNNCIVNNDSDENRKNAVRRIGAEVANKEKEYSNEPNPDDIYIKIEDSRDESDQECSSSDAVLSYDNGPSSSTLQRFQGNEEENDAYHQNEVHGASHRLIFHQPFKPLYVDKNSGEKVTALSQNSEGEDCTSFNMASDFCNDTMPLGADNDETTIIPTWDGRFECGICSRVMESRSVVRKHLRTHTTGRPYQCSTCGKTFKWKNSLSYHLSIHTGEKPYACTGCEKRFPNKSAMNQHIKYWCKGHMLAEEKSTL